MQIAQQGPLAASVPSVAADRTTVPHEPSAPRGMVAFSDMLAAVMAGSGGQTVAPTAAPAGDTDVKADADVSDIEAVEPDASELDAFFGVGTIFADTDVRAAVPPAGQCALVARQPVLDEPVVSSDAIDIVSGGSTADSNFAAPALRVSDGSGAIVVPSVLSRFATTTAMPVADRFGLPYSPDAASPATEVTAGTVPAATVVDIPSITTTVARQSMITLVETGDIVPVPAGEMNPAAVDPTVTTATATRAIDRPAGLIPTVPAVAQPIPAKVSDPTAIDEVQTDSTDASSAAREHGKAQHSSPAVPPAADPKTPPTLFGRAGFPVDAARPTTSGGASIADRSTLVASAGDDLPTSGLQGLIAPFAAETGGVIPTATSFARPVLRPQTPLLAQHLSGQLAVEIRHKSDGVTELALDPVELGRVRMTVTTTDQTLTLVLMAERPETTDLMRRHGDVLQQEFRNLGFTTVNLSFAGGDNRPGSQGAAGVHPREAASDGESHGDAEIAAAATTAPRKRTADGSLDLRL